MSVLPGERPGRPARDAAGDLDVEISEPVRTVVEPGARHGVRDEREPSLRGLPDHRGGDRRDVDPVEDQLHDDVGPRKRRADDTRIAVMERAHGVEEVRDAPHAEIEGRVRLLGGRVGVTARDGDLAAEQQLDDRRRARELGRQRDQPDGPRIEKALEQLGIGVAASARWVDPQAERRQERPFQMRAEDAGPVRLGRHLAEGGEELLFGGRDEGRQECGDTGLEQCLAGLAVAVGVGGEEVDTGESVHLQVDEPGHGDPVAVRR